MIISSCRSIRPLTVLAALVLLGGCVTVESLRKTRAAIPPPPPAEEGPEARQKYEASMLGKQEGLLKQVAPEKERVHPIVEGEQLVTAAVYARRGRQQRNDPAGYQIFTDRLLATIADPQPRQETPEIEPAEHRRRLAAWAVYALAELEDRELLPQLVAALEVEAAVDSDGDHRLHALEGCARQVEALGSDLELGERVLVGADAARKAVDGGGVSTANAERMRVLATYLIDELKNLQSVVALQRGYLDGRLTADAAVSALTWNHQLLAVFASGERALPAAGILDANREALLRIAAVDDPRPRRAARLLLAAHWPRSCAAWLARRITAGEEDGAAAVQLVNLLPLVDQLCAHLPRGGGVTVDEPAVLHDTPEALAEAEWQRLRPAALDRIGTRRHELLDEAEAEVVLARLLAHDPLVVAGWLRRANDPGLPPPRLSQEMRHRHLLLTNRVVARDPRLVGELEIAIAADLRRDDVGLRHQALQYLVERAPRRLLRVALAELPTIDQESPPGALALVQVCIAAVQADEGERGPGRLEPCLAMIEGEAVACLGAPMVRLEHDLRDRWFAFLLPRRPEILVAAVSGQVGGREDRYDLRLLGELLRDDGVTADGRTQELALFALVTASRSADVERQLHALRLLGEWGSGQAVAALAGRLAEGDLSPAAVELATLALEPHLGVAEGSP